MEDKYFQNSILALVVTWFLAGHAGPAGVACLVVLFLLFVAFVLFCC